VHITGPDLCLSFQFLSDLNPGYCHILQFLSDPNPPQTETDRPYPEAFEQSDKTTRTLDCTHTIQSNYTHLRPLYHAKFAER
jgi:hypothetical protein